MAGTISSAFVCRLADDRLRAETGRPGAVNHDISLTDVGQENRRRLSNPDQDDTTPVSDDTYDVIDDTKIPSTPPTAESNQHSHQIRVVPGNTAPIDDPEEILHCTKCGRNKGADKDNACVCVSNDGDWNQFGQPPTDFQQHHPDEGLPVVTNTSPLPVASDRSPYGYASSIPAYRAVDTTTA